VQVELSRLLIRMAVASPGLNVSGAETFPATIATSRDLQIDANLLTRHFVQTLANEGVRRQLANGQAVKSEFRSVKNPSANQLSQP
jgi:hypothetical protein